MSAFRHSSYSAFRPVDAQVFLASRVPADALLLTIMTDQAKPGSLISDQQWADIKQQLPSNLMTRVTKRDAEYRQFVATVLWVVSNNATWPNVLYPEGTWRSVYVRYLRWVELGRWDCVARGLGNPLGEALRAHVERTHARLQWRVGRQQARVVGQDIA